jgi:branched-chain amino acid transport system substrate-binding protein
MAVLFALFLLPAPVFAEQSPLIIGVAGAHSGDLAPYGIPTKEAVEMLAADLNAKGGLLGRPVQLLVLDDQCKPEIAANVASAMASKGAQAVIGHICSGATKAALGIYKEAKIITISPSATNPELTQGGKYPNFYRTIAPDDKQGQLAAAFATTRLGVKKIAVIHDKGDYGKGFADAARAELEKSGKVEVVLYEGITPGAMDYSAVIQKVRHAGADAVIYGGYHPEASKLIVLMKKKRVDVPFIGPDGLMGNGLLSIAGANAEGVYATGPMNVASYPVNQQVRTAYLKRYGHESGMFFDQGVAAWQVLVAAIQAAGGTDSAALAKALKGNPVETSVGRIKFDARGDAEGVGFAVYQVQGGKFAELK